jgi:hypothetical protein
VKGLAGDDLESFEVDLVFAIEAQVSLREILADHADELDGGKEARGHGGVAGRAAEEARVMGLGCFDGIQSRGADNKNTHFSLNFRISMGEFSGQKGKSPHPPSRLKKAENRKQKAEI